MSVKCIPEVDLYWLILQKAEEAYPNKPIRLIFKQDLGLSEGVYYDIKNFCQGKELKSSKSKKKPLHTDRLKELCDKLEINFKGIYFMVEAEHPA